MTTKTVKQIKSGSAEFLAPSAGYLAHIKSKYINAGKLTITKNKISENEVETIFNFSTEEARLEFIQDPVVGQEHQNFVESATAAGVQVAGDIQ